MKETQNSTFQTASLGEHGLQSVQQLSEDTPGKGEWVRTRMCFCPTDSDTDCRFHKTTEPGWEKCPYLEKAQVNSKITGRWLWAKKLAGKQKQSEVQEAA